MGEKVDDLRLVAAMARAAAGDMDGFEEIVRAYEGPVYSFLRRMTSDEAVAAELCQETMLRAFGALGRYRRGSPVSPWIFRIARNLVIDHLRRAEHRYRRSPEDVDGLLPDAARRAPENPERILETQRALELVHAALVRLRPAYREILLLGLVEQLGYEEMAEVTGDSPSAVKARFLRARAALRDEMERLMRRASK